MSNSTRLLMAACRAALEFLTNPPLGDSTYGAREEIRAKLREALAAANSDEDRRLVFCAKLDKGFESARAGDAGE